MPNIVLISVSNGEVLSPDSSDGRACRLLEAVPASMSNGTSCEVDIRAADFSALVEDDTFLEKTVVSRSGDLAVDIGMPLGLRRGFPPKISAESKTAGGDRDVALTLGREDLC